MPLVRATLFFLVLLGGVVAENKSFAMDDEKFWSIIENSKQEYVEDEQHGQMQALSVELLSLSEKELVEFYRIYVNYLGRSYHWDLWAAGYILNGGCSDDCFAYFRNALIAQGKTVFENALKDLETLVGILDPANCEFDGFESVPIQVFQNKFGKEMPIVGSHPSEPQGQVFAEETLDEKYPKLAEAVEEYWRRHPLPPNIQKLSQ